jgi:hypothetical protein
VPEGSEPTDEEAGRGAAEPRRQSWLGEPAPAEFLLSTAEEGGEHKQDRKRGQSFGEDRRGQRPAGEDDRGGDDDGERQRDRGSDGVLPGGDPPAEPGREPRPEITVARSDDCDGGERWSERAGDQRQP